MPEPGLEPRPKAPRASAFGIVGLATSAACSVAGPQISADEASLSPVVPIAVYAAAMLLLGLGLAGVNRQVRRSHPVEHSRAVPIAIAELAAHRARRLHVGITLACVTASISMYLAQSELTAALWAAGMFLIPLGPIAWSARRAGQALRAIARGAAEATLDDHRVYVIEGAVLVAWLELSHKALERASRHVFPRASVRRDAGS